MKKTKLLTKIAIFVAIGLVLQLVDSLVPLPLPIVGAKIGLANIATVCSLVVFSPITVIAIAAIRSFLGGMLFGGGMAIVYSVSGALGAAIVSLLVYKCKSISLIGVSILSAVTHNAMQIAVAAIVLNNLNVISYFPVLMLISAFSGSLVGYIGGLFNERKNIFGFKFAKTN